MKRILVLLGTVVALLAGSIAAASTASAVQNFGGYRCYTDLSPNQLWAVRNCAGMFAIWDGYSYSIHSEGWICNPSTPQDGSVKLYLTKLKLYYVNSGVPYLMDTRTFYYTVACNADNQDLYFSSLFQEGFCGGTFWSWYSEFDYKVIWPDGTQRVSYVTSHNWTPC